MKETKYCAMEYCDTEATHLTNSGMPLCFNCATAYEMGQDNPYKPLELIEE